MQNLDLLSQLALKYGTDKCPQIKHSYTPFYYKLLKDKRESIKKVLEIGIGTGASLLMWREFFPNAQIYGLDILPEALYNDKRIKSYLYDQTKKSDLLELISNIGSDLDLIVDDGSHRRADQVIACKTLMSIVKKDVIYVIEDAPNSRKVAQALSEYNCFIPEIEHLYRDDQLIIVRNKNMVIDKQTNITIFAKPAFLNVHPNQPFKYEGKPPKRGHLMRISSMTRGEQIADYIGAKLNPTDGYQNDICIYVKPPYERGQDFLFEGKKSYLDICDAPVFIDLLKKHPEVTVISASDLMFEVLTKTLPNKVINIPEHHCNFERLKRNRKEITTVGCISASTGLFKHIPQDLKEQLSERGMEFIEVPRMFTRQDVVNFYLSIDIQIIWRPYMDASKNNLRNPLKIVNASSFGIPTIMYEENSAKEMDGCYIPVHSLDEFLTELDKLRSDPKLYDQYAKRCIEKSEEYHIEKIAQLYKNLATDNPVPKNNPPISIPRRKGRRPPWYSSYEENNYGELFFSLMRVYQPEIVVELGTKAGFSAYHMARGLKANGKGRLYCYDLWEHDAMYEMACKNLKGFEEILQLNRQDAIDVDKIYETVDILHVDLGNQGEKLEKIIPLWIDKVRQVIILEGGSSERDKRSWMINLGVQPIRDWLKDFSRLRADIEYITIEPFPSVTIIKKK